MGAKTDRIRELEAQLAERDQLVEAANARATIATDDAQKSAGELAAVTGRLEAGLQALAELRARAAAQEEALRDQLVELGKTSAAARAELETRIGLAGEERDTARARTTQLEGAVEELREPLRRRGVELEDTHDSILLARRAAAELEVKHGAPREALEKELRTLRARVAELEKGSDNP